jgi:hypothetical protein
MDTLKESNTNFQDWTFDHKALFEHWFALVQPFTGQGPGIGGGGGGYPSSLVYTGQGPGTACYKRDMLLLGLTLQKMAT